MLVLSTDTCMWCYFCTCIYHAVRGSFGCFPCCIHVVLHPVCVVSHVCDLSTGSCACTKQVRKVSTRVVLSIPYPVCAVASWLGSSPAVCMRCWPGFLTLLNSHAQGILYAVEETLSFRRDVKRHSAWRSGTTQDTAATAPHPDIFPYWYVCGFEPAVLCLNYERLNWHCPFPYYSTRPTS